ncbi:hypothetical protein FD13_GL000570 [Levilactobacillus senmaizukei DSM 21775 = NBRC 103853]|uniref:DUF1694 domain-containing protein n=1 Tax=Levilactobacillus senmaizukei DSM 21775 = NBRC 103853 TaxID=1423803 RepID=A0A0R2DP91_9LACO|nr:YueI family protein [Levilactobacillus senmaizukei]KRN01741.1 hypothetical protein FD13_GL000570 [Levilactobacillus senmaizukei DSM 21775 = NBRC 103853]
MAEKSLMEQHIQKAQYGTPKVNPDEQRHYLGTFRERISLMMTIAEVTSHQHLDAFTTEITAHPDYQLILNGHIDQANLAPYLKLASQHQVRLTIRQEAIYGEAPDELGLIVASNQAINQNPISLNKKYPQKIAPTPPTVAPKRSWWQRLWHRD